MHREALLQPPEDISVLGSGWLGLPLARRLAQAGHYVRASTTSPARFAEIRASGAIPFIIEISHISDILREFIRSDILIVNIPSRDGEGFSGLIDELALSPVKHVIYASSTSVYPNANSVISETDGVELSTSPFLIIENLFRNCNRFNTTVLRFGGLIGYSRHPGRFFSHGRPVQNPDATVNLIHRDDCIGIICKVMEKQAWGEVFNCCADTHPSRREFYSQAARSLGLAEPVFEDNGRSPGKTINNHKLKRVLGYEFKHPDLMKITFEENS
jgi:nucleoside-diphosphate-sugar epimerase